MSWQLAVGSWQEEEEVGSGQWAVGSGQWGANVERLSSIVFVRCGANVVLVLNGMVLVLVLEMRCETPHPRPALP